MKSSLVAPLLVPLILIAAANASALEPAGNSLGTVKRVFVESLGSSSPAIMLRDMVISSIANSGVFSITENADHADAVLRGSADDQVFTEEHRSSDNISAGLHSGSSGSYSSKYDRSGSSKNGGLTLGQNESMQSSERRHEASASVRLVNRDGDVIWSTTQESKGAKFRSSSADVADKIFRKLTDDYQRARSASMQAGMPVR